MNVSFDQMTAVAGGVNLEFVPRPRHTYGLCSLCDPAAASECYNLRECACTPPERKDQANGYWKEVKKCATI